MGSPGRVRVTGPLAAFRWNPRSIRRDQVRRGKCPVR
jgi:hypothetical protein